MAIGLHSWMLKDSIFFEKDNSNSEIYFSNFPVLHRELLLAKQIFPEC